MSFAQSMSLTDMDLTTTQMSGGGVLTPGRYVVRVKEATFEKTQTGGAGVRFKLEDVNGSGVISYWINTHLPGKEKAQEIGRGELKRLLTVGGHPNPNKPSDIGLYKGLTFGATIRANTYEDKFKNVRNSVEVGAVFDASEIDPAKYPPKAVTAASGFAVIDNGGDKIPF